MRYLRPRLATDFQKEKHSGLFTRIIDRLDPNPDYQYQLVREWLIEFGDDDLPFPEIGLNENGRPIFTGPDDRNYGFWLDTNMKYDGFKGEVVSPEIFEALWVESHGRIQSWGAT